MRTTLPLLLLVGPLASCGGGAQLDAGAGDPPPRPLATIGGFVDDGGARPTRPFGMRLVWHDAVPPEYGRNYLDDMGGPEWSIVERVDGWAEPHPDLPYYSVGLYQPPSPVYAVRLAPGEPAFTYATAVAYPSEGTSTFWGEATGYWILYFFEPVTADTLTAWWLGRTAEVGYHHAAVSGFCPQGELDDCAAALAESVPTADSDVVSSLCAATYRLEEIAASTPERLSIDHVASTPGCP